MKIPDTELKGKKDPGLLEWMDYVGLILNNGRYECRTVSEVPTWIASEGEFVFYASGALRRIYFYIGGEWKYVGWGLGSGLSLIADADYDTKVDTEESADEDCIRMDTGGTEALVIDAVQDIEVKAGSFAIPQDEKYHMEGLTGDTYMLYNSTSDYIELWVDGSKRMEL